MTNVTDHGVEVWDDKDTDDFEVEQDTVVDPQLLKLICFIASFFLSWQAIFRIPDVAVSVLFQFIRIFLLKLFSLVKCTKYADDVSQIFPRNMDQARKFLSIKRDSFDQLVVCTECHSIYDYDDIMKRTVHQIVKCSYVRFRQHPQKRMRSPCNFALLKTIKTSSGKQIFRPLKLFCYRSLIQSLKEFVERPGIVDLIGHWKQRKIPNGVLADIYDGIV